MAAPGKITHPRRGEVYLVSLDPTVGAEIRKTRPGLVLQSDIANRSSPITIVAAITSQFGEPLYPTEVLILAREGGLATDSVVLLNPDLLTYASREMSGFRRLAVGARAARVWPGGPGRRVQSGVADGWRSAA